PQSFSFKIGSFAFAFAAADIFSGVSKLIVNDVSTSETIRMLANSQARLPNAFASRSQKAQSNALRAAPGGKRSCRPWRFKFFSPAIDSICANTEAVV